MIKNFYKNKFSSGVTLVELIVVLAIFMVITGVIIFNYGNLNSSLSIQNLADDIALSVRRAQGYAIGVRGYSGVFNDGFGIHFTTDPDTSELYAGSNKSFVLFTDLNATPNKKYDYGAYDKCGNPVLDNECIDVLSITTADKILGIYLENDADPIPDTGTLDILFTRPNPEPVFCYRRRAYYTSCNSRTISFVRIVISNSGTPQITKTISIANNGQITVY